MLYGLLEPLKINGLAIFLVDGFILVALENIDIEEVGII